MRRVFEAMLIAVLFIVGFSSVEASVRTGPQSPGETSQSRRVKIFQPGPDVTSPELLALNVAPPAIEKCHEKLDGKVVFSVIVDASGKPRNPMFLHPLANVLDKVALQVAARDRFKPGLRQGSPVAMEQSLEVEIKTCVDETTDGAGTKTMRLQLRSLPEQKLGTVAQPTTEAIFSTSEIPWKSTGVVPPAASPRTGRTVPVPLNTVQAEYTPEARRARLEGVCLVSLIVDPQGLPVDIHLVKGFDPGMDKNALIAAAKYRFRPAIEDGEPIPASITVQVRFQMR